VAHNIFIVEDHPVTRRGYVSLIEYEPDLTVCGEASTFHEALGAIPRSPADLVMVDIALDDMSGLELIKHLKAQRPEVPILVVSMHDEVLYAERALRAGAAGYLMKREPAAEVITAIRSVLRGELFLSAKMHSRMLQHYLKEEPERAASPIECLTDRELEVFTLHGRGLTTDQVAEAMLISPKTVATYRRRIKEKLAIATTEELRQRAALWVQDN
jgi:DNA-binding NarL/FixJ family response regulator